MEIFACIIGRAVRPSSLIKHLSHDPFPVDMVFPFWVLRDDAGEVTLIDTGFSSEPAIARNVSTLRDPSTLLQGLGIAPRDVKRVIVSHLHWDHFCNPERYPNAEFLIQKADIDYFRGYGAAHPAASVGDKQSLAELDTIGREGRVLVLDGDSSIMPGVKTYLVGGHTPGIQVTVVEFGGKPVVFACDASHLYWNLENRTPTSIINDYTKYIQGFEKIDALRGPGGLWFPGHDPAIIDRLQAVSAGTYQLVR